jgi:predicted nucleotidyltransferase
MTLKMEKKEKRKSAQNKKILDKDQIKRQVIEILKKNDIKRAALFGSIVTDSMTEQSDIDILIEADPEMSLLDFVRIKLELEEKLLRSVDLVEFGTLKPQIQNSIHTENLILS